MSKAPINNDTLYKSFVPIWYEAGSALLVSESATHLPTDELAIKVYDYVIQNGYSTADRTSTEQIKELNRHGFRIEKPKRFQRFRTLIPPK